MVIKNSKRIIVQDLPNMAIRNSTFDEVLDQLKIVVNNGKAVKADDLWKGENIGISTQSSSSKFNVGTIICKH